ncbi:MAG TPA: hypothetical protein VI138_03935 [Candidatus Dormibacteraeota bacterium]
MVIEPIRRSCSGRRLLLGLATTALWGGLGLIGGPTVLAAGMPGYQVLIGGAGGVEMLTPGAGAVTPIPNLPQGAIPSTLAASPDGSQVYLAFPSGQIGVIDTSTATYLSTSTDLGAGSDPEAMVVTPDGQDLYVGEAGEGQVVEVDLATGAVKGSPIPLTSPTHLAISKDGAWLFADGPGSSSIAVVATATNTVSSTIPLTGAGEMVLSPDGTSLYVLSQTATSSTVAVVDPATQTLAGPPLALPAGDSPAEMVPSLDGTALYVAEPKIDQVEIVNTTTEALQVPSELTTLGLSPQALGLSPDGATLYVAGAGPSGAEEITSTALGTGAATTPIAAGSGPAAIVVVPTAAQPAPSPSASPTPASSCPAPGPIQVDPYVGATGAAPSPAAPTGQPASNSTGALSPGASSSPATSPAPQGGTILCFGGLALPGRASPDAAMAAGAASTGSSGLLWPGVLALVLLGAGALLLARRQGWHVASPRGRLFRGRR